MIVIFLDIPRSMWRLACNPIYIVTCLGACMELIIVSGFVVFLPKYLETQFSLGKSQASVFTGTESYKILDAILLHIHLRINRNSRCMYWNFYGWLHFKKNGITTQGCRSICFNFKHNLFNLLRVVIFLGL